MLVLQIVVQAETLRREVLADHGHPEVGTVLAAVAFRNRKTQMAGGIGEVFSLAQQRFPFMPRQAAIVEIGARPFAAVIEKADVVVGLLQRLDLARDESIEFVEIGDEVGGQCKIHGGLPECRLLCLVATEHFGSRSIKVGRPGPSQAKSGDGISLVTRGSLA